MDLQAQKGAISSRTPFVLLRFPRLLVALAFGVLLLVGTLAAYPLFISAETGRLVQAQIDRPESTRYGAGITYQLRSQHDTTFADQSQFVCKGQQRPFYFFSFVCHFSLQHETQKFAAWTSRSPLLGPVISGALAPPMRATGTGGETTLRLFTGTDSIRHVHVLERGEGDENAGVWLADNNAKSLGLEPGDNVVIDSGPHSVTLPVAGIYRALVTQPRTGFWQQWNTEIYPTCPAGDGLCPQPPSFAIVDAPLFHRLFDQLAVNSTEYSWNAPVKAGHELTIDEAHDLADFENAFASASGRPKSDFPCCRGFATLQLSIGPSMRIGMPLVVDTVDKQQAALVGPARVLRVAGVIVALAVIAAAGVFSVGARRVEASLRFARGTSAFAAGARACAESILPGLIGAVVGLAVATWLARAGPGGAISSSATHDALIGGAIGLAVALLLLGLVTAATFLQNSELHRARFAALGRLPWELVLIALAVFAWQRLRHNGAFILDPTTHTTRPSLDLLLFPVLAIAGFGMLGARLFGYGLKALRNRSSRFSSWSYLAVHRLAGGSRLTLLLVSASVLCLGVFLETQTVVHSLQTTVDAKAGLFVGSEVQGRIFYFTPQPKNFPMPVTRTTRVQNAGEFASDGAQFDLLTVDPKTFASAAYWRDGLASESPQEIMDRLEGPKTDGVPIALTGGGDPGSIAVQGVNIPVNVVARASAFPGMSSKKPLVVIDESRLLEALSGVSGPLTGPNASTELWVKGPTDQARRALESVRFPPYLIVTADQVKDIPVISAIIDTFVVLQALALVAALLVVIAMLMYLQARQRSQVVSYGLSLRMGMSHSRHRRSLVAELGTMLGASFIIGLVLAIGVAVYLVKQLDPLPAIPPNPLFVRPVGVVAVAFLSVAAVSWLAGWLTNRRARSLDLGDVMRLAE